MEPEDSLPHSPVPATCPYPEPARPSPHPHIPLSEDLSLYYPPIYAWVFQVILSLGLQNMQKILPSRFNHGTRTTTIMSKLIQMTNHDVEENVMVRRAAGNVTRRSAHRATEVTHVVQPYWGSQLSLN